MSPWTGSAVPCIRFDAPFEKYNNLHQSIGRDTSKAVSLHAGTPESEAREIAAIFAQLVRDNGGTPLLNSPTPEEVKAASKYTKQAEKLYKAQLNAQQPSGPSMFGAILSSIVDAAAPLAASADPNGIQNAANQQLGNIQMRQAQVQAAQAAQQRPQQAASVKTVPSFPLNASAKPVVNSGIAPPPTCVDLGPGNCVPIAQYQQQQAQLQQMGGIDTLCPASGFIPGVMTHPAPDVALGVQCKPGSVIYHNGVATFTMPDGSTPPGLQLASTGGGATSGGNNGQDSNPHHLVTPGNLNNCIAFDFNGKTPLSATGWDRYTDNCGVPVNVTVLFGSGTGGASGIDLSPGQSAGTANSSQDYTRMGGGHYYTCPGGYGAADMSGNYLIAPAANYVCRQHGW
jgi:hypothetical protein